MSFDRAATFVLAQEGDKLVDNPADPGALTRYGIALARHPELKADDIRAMTPERARSIYFSDYWLKVAGDQMPDVFSVPLLDAAIVQGPGEAIKFLQRALYLTADGIAGPGTIGAARRAMPTQPVLARFDAERVLHFASLPTWSQFGRGWVTRAALAILP